MPVLKAKQLPVNTSTAWLHDDVVAGCSKIMWMCEYPWSKASKRTCLRTNTVVNIQSEQNPRWPTNFWGFHCPYCCIAYTICVESELFSHSRNPCTEGGTTPSKYLHHWIAWLPGCTVLRNNLDVSIFMMRSLQANLLLHKHCFRVSSTHSDREILGVFNAHLTIVWVESELFPHFLDACTEGGTTPS